MTLWRLELARLTRTARGIAVLGLYAFFGLLGPFTARYMGEIFERFATEEMTITFADPTPLDGIVQFVSNTSQLGLLAVIVIAAGALAVDARPEAAAFLRTRVPHARDLIVPRYVVVTAAAALALVLGTVVAAVTTELLIGGVPLGGLVVGTLYGVLYLAFAVAMVAAVAGFMRSQLATVFVAVAALLVIPIVGVIDVVSPWLPSTLLSAVVALAAGESAPEYLRAVGVTLVATVGLLALAVQRTSRREL